MIIRAHSTRVLVSGLTVVVVILAGRVVGMAAVAVGSTRVCGGRKSEEEDAEKDRNEFFHGDTNFRNGKQKGGERMKQNGPSDLMMVVSLAASIAALLISLARIFLL